MTKVSGGSWVMFWLVFFALAAFDIFCLAPRSTEGRAVQLSGRTAALHCAFWFFVGIFFNLIVWAHLGHEEAIVWFNGYILEYLLSMDNVFFFHVVFQSYATPPSQVYKALFLGILGAVVLRLAFYFIGAEFFRMAFVVQVLFGLVLIWSGYETITSNEEDDDPRENRCVQLITKYLPVTESYAEDGSLFTRVQARTVGCAVELPESSPPAEAIGASTTVSAVDTEAEAAGPRLGGSEQRWKGTLLLLVVLVLQVVDVVFAVDSVTAKIAENDSIFLDFTSSAFAMLCLRPMYFVMAKLMKYFRLLKYGVGLILALIGVKLIVGHWVEIPSLYSMIFIVITFSISIILSILFPEKAYDEMDDNEAKAEGTVGAESAPGGERRM